MVTATFRPELKDVSSCVFHLFPRRAAYSLPLNFVVRRSLFAAPCCHAFIFRAQRPFGGVLAENAMQDAGKPSTDGATERTRMSTQVSEHTGMCSDKLRREVSTVLDEM